MAELQNHKHIAEMQNVFDFLIVGQGLAGSFLAYELLKTGAKVLVLDNPQGASSSKVAAGLFNPVTGKRFVKTWLCDDIFTNIFDYYQNLEKLFGEKLIHNLPIIRPLESIKQQNQIISLADDPENKPYVQFLKSNQEINEFTEVKYGVLSTKIGGWIDIPLLLEHFKNYFISKYSYSAHNVEYNEIEIEGNKVKYKNYECRKVIFCEGYGANNNPFFNWLPFNAVKGEILNIKMNSSFKNQILLKGIFILPIKANLYRIGATYNWEDKSNNITENGKNELIGKLKKITHNDFEIIDQKAGIRPATVDRRPFIGLHPKQVNIGIFNGLGTKGVSLGPYFSQLFANFLIKNEQLNSEVNINRFSSLYLSSYF